MHPLIIANAEQIVTPRSRAAPQRGKAMGIIRVWKNKSISLDPKTGKIIAIGPWRKVKEKNAKVIEGKNHLVFPGFVDSHTHPIYAGSRVNEYLLRGEGVPYLEILAKGGGILATVRATEKASNALLTQRTLRVLRTMMTHGTTTLEAKTGYGLSTKQELRELKILQRLKKLSPMELFITFLGAHAIPERYRTRPNAYIDLICNTMLPQIAKRKLADFCDVFCEEGVFSVRQGRKILEMAIQLGIKIRVHADEFKPIGGTELGVSLKAFSVDHLMGISETGIRILSRSDTAAILLPCTSFFLGKETYAPAQELIHAGAIVALATDFNAGSNQSYSMQMAASLGLLKMKMTPEQVLVATTLHGAYALGISDRVGSLHPGKQADLVLIEGDDYREVFYRFGTNQVKTVIKRGKVVS